jgi:hypothetical protein
LTALVATAATTAFEPLEEAPAPAVGLVDAAIELVELERARVVEQELQQRGLVSRFLEGEVERKQLNRLSRRAIDSVQVATPMRDLVKEALLHPDASLRQAAAEIGAAAKLPTCE